LLVFQGNADQPGVNTRALGELFRLKSEREASGIETVSVELTMVEVYNDQVKDLLRPAATKSGSKDEAGGDKAALCDIRLRPESEGGGVHLPTATVLQVQSETEVSAAMARGQASRSVGKTKANEHSSRSHSVLMINVACHNAATHTHTVGRLCLVDLAGSERIAKTGATGETLKEAQNINKSLSALGNVISALRAKQDSGGNKDSKGSSSSSSHVPYRDSKLTYLLQDSLGADNKTLVIVQVSPEQKDVQETVCSLTFGQRARNVELGGGGSISGGRGSSASHGPGKAGSGGSSKAGGGASSAAAAVALAKAQQDAKEHAKRAATLAERLAEESKSLKAAEKALQLADVAKAKAVSGAEQEVKSLKAQLESAKANAARVKQQATAAAAASATTQASKTSTKAAAAAAAAAAEQAAEDKARAEGAAEASKLRDEMERMRANYEQQVCEKSSTITLSLVIHLYII
jgi:hypothetical protein